MTEDQGKQVETQGYVYHRDYQHKILEEEGYTYQGCFVGVKDFLWEMLLDSNSLSGVRSVIHEHFDFNSYAMQLISLNQLRFYRCRDGVKVFTK